MTQTFVATDLPKVIIPLTTLAELNIMKNSTALHGIRVMDWGDIILPQSYDMNSSSDNP